MCNKLQTQLHTLSNCCFQLDRFKWRHDSVLRCIYNFFLPPCVNYLLTDLNLVYNPQANYFNHYDHILSSRMRMKSLLSNYETNTSKSKSYKQTRYKHLKSDLRQPCSKFTTIYLEITTLGFITSNTFLKLVIA